MSTAAVAAKAVVRELKSLSVVIPRDPKCISWMEEEELKKEKKEGRKSKHKWVSHAFKKKFPLLLCFRRRRRRSSFGRDA